MSAAFNAALVAARLGHAQRAVILSLTGDWGKAANSRTARRMFYGVGAERHTLVLHKHMTDNCWRLSERGQQVKCVLEREQ